MAKTEVKETLKLTYPRLEPFRVVGDYITSKQEIHSLHLPSFQFDKPSQDPDLHLTEVRRQYFSIEKDLEAKRDYYKDMRTKLDKQWDNLFNLETEFKENFIKLAAFITSNEGKRARAIARCADDKKLIKERSKEITKMKERMNLLRISKEEIDKEIRFHRIYEKYLNSVVATSEEFRNASEVINRYESLMATKNELGLRQQYYFSQLENAKSQIAKTSDENKFRILGLNTVIAGLRSRYKTASSNAMKWETIVCDLKEIGLQKFKDITEVKLASRNIYKLMCKRKGETLKIPDEDFERHLNYIKKTLNELKIVKRKAAIKQQKTHSSMKGEVSKKS